MTKVLIGGDGGRTKETLRQMLESESTIEVVVDEAKKPVNIYRLLDEIGFCPTCKLKVYNDGTIRCPHCNQKLKWE